MTIAQKLEPRAPVSARRFAAVEALLQAGIFAGILLMPVLPFIENSIENAEGIVNRAAESGARFIHPAFGVTLRQNQRVWYFDALDALFPGEGLRARYARCYGNSYEPMS